VPQHNEKNSSSSKPAAPDNVKLPVIVAIGASAGGVHALQSLFGAVPNNTGAAFVVVVHLDPQHRSELVNIIAARTRMPVIEIGTRQHLEANHVYVIPPDRRLQMIDHEISALEFDEPRGQRAPIDLFFRSLAEKLGDGFAVILSGAGSDGSTGVRAVKEAGGIILVQEPKPFSPFDARRDTKAISLGLSCRRPSCRERPDVGGDVLWPSGASFAPRSWPDTFRH
jgi:two-component system, chemotaxis family, CheB/CheR fusion protein